MDSALFISSVILLLTCLIYLRLWFCPNRIRMIRRDWARLRAEWRGDDPPPFDGRITRNTWL